MQTPSRYASEQWLGTANSRPAFGPCRDRDTQRKDAAMGFFETFWTWLNTELGAYVGDNTARVSAAMEPAIVTLATLYVMVWGYLQLTGRIEEPFVPGLKRILTIAVVLGVSLRMW